MGNLCPEVQKKLRALWRPLTAARPPLTELTQQWLKDGSHPWAAPASSTEQPALNLTQSLWNDGCKDRTNVWEIYVASWLHRARVLSTSARTVWKRIQSVSQRHASLEDPLHGAGLVTSDFSLEKTMTKRVPAKPVALLWQWGVCGVVWCIYSDIALMEKPPFKEMGSKPGPQWGLVWSCYCGGGFYNNCIIKHFTKRVMNSGKEWGLYILFKQRKLLSALAAKHDPQLGGTEANIRETIKAES